MISAHSGAQIREAERPLLDSGMGAVLMSRASYGLASAIVSELRSRGERLYGCSVTVLAGKGNNGGDGLFAAALLARRGMRTTAVLTAAVAHAEALGAFERAGGRVLRLAENNMSEAVHAACSAVVLIDAVLGTGAIGGLRGSAAELVHRISEGRWTGEQRLTRVRPGLVVACDLPSGVDADTGQLHSPVLGADLTVTFGAAKIGLLCDPGAGAAGHVETVKIGIEQGLPTAELRRLETADLAALLPAPSRRAHKYSRGVLGIVAGSAEYPGAGVLACQAALAAGAGMIRYLGPPEVGALVQQSCPEVVLGHPDVAQNHVQAWLVGPGVSGDEQLDRCAAALETDVPVVVDAAALPKLPKDLTPNVVLTPHAGELAAIFTHRGLEISREQVEAGTFEAAQHAAGLFGATVLLKGAATVIATPAGSNFSQSEGTSWLGTAGSGDVLAGILGALLAQLGHNNEQVLEDFAGHGIEASDTWAAIASMAASLHGRAGRIAAGVGVGRSRNSSAGPGRVELHGGAPLHATDIVKAVPEAWRDILNESTL
ncbi:NAD(P)H-hydrate dehydratase [Pseudarthrobacter sp. J1738]|uniref:NAD(P)H-hydrate dehydratase n=1 Tax=unclassified Pseudarthrobacter TaxID=2647000 RepID=UPI003D2A11C2